MHVCVCRTALQGEGEGVRCVCVCVCMCRTALQGVQDSSARRGGRCQVCMCVHMYVQNTVCRTALQGEGEGVRCVCVYYVCVCRTALQGEGEGVRCVHMYVCAGLGLIHGGIKGEVS